MRGVTFASQVGLFAGGRADVMAPSAANMPAWASAGALLRAQDSQSRDYGRQLAGGGGEMSDEEVRRQPRPGRLLRADLGSACAGHCAAFICCPCSLSAQGNEQPTAP
jgi:hypothetical protein